MKAVISFFILALMSLSAGAQDFRVIRGDCMPAPEGDTVAGVRSAKPFKLVGINTNWDSTRVYKQLVILVEFKGDSTYFQMENPREYHNHLFNTNGFNERNGKGCVAEYFRDQSNGLLNIQFDVFGPYVLDKKAQPYIKPEENTRNYGREVMVEATRLFLAENPDWDFKQYDWYNNGKVTQVIFVFAGAAGNQADPKVWGYLWPNTSSFSTITTHDGMKISNYTSSAEKWHPNYPHSCGIGTICHEFSHALGLPDIYPTTSGAGFSVCDEWELMDGGNFTNFGWCPPNFTAFEKSLFGWTTLYELNEPTTVRDLKPLSEGGVAYVVKHTDNEYLVLENRQYIGWDACAPGKGLVIYHVQYSPSVWNGNTVNNNAAKRRFELVHADNLDYDGWVSLLDQRGIVNPWAVAHRMNNRLLSTSPYPWTTDSTTFVNDQLTDESVPAVKMNTANAEGSMTLGKPITNIQMSEEGYISFDFMGGDDTAVNAIRQHTSGSRQLYDMTGRQLSSVPSSRMYIIRGADGRVRKVIR